MNEPNIIAYGPVVRTDANTQCRIVLRSPFLSSQYVVHTEVTNLEENRTWYSDGFYYQNESDRPKAINKFMRRIEWLEGMTMPKQG